MNDLIRSEQGQLPAEPIDYPQQPGYGYGVDPNAESEIRLLDYWRAIRKRLWMIIGMMMIGTTLAVLHVARKPDIYQAGARVQVDLENNPALGKNAPYIFSPTNDPVYFNTQLQVLSSQGLMRRVVKTLDLEHNPDFFKSPDSQKRSTWQNVKRMAGFDNAPAVVADTKSKDVLQLKTNVGPSSASSDLEEAKRLAPYVGAILGGLTVEPVKEARGTFYKDTRMIDIRYTHTNPEVTAKVVNAIAETYVYNNLEKKTDTNVTTADFLQKRIAELQQQIRTDEERLVNYARSNEIISLDAKQNTVVERLAGLNGQLLEAENDRKTAEAAFNAAKAPGAAAAMIEAELKGSKGTETQLAELRQKRSLLLVDATEQSPEVKEVDSQIKELERQSQELRSKDTATLMTNLETKYRQALGREQALRQAFNQSRGETLTQNEAAINYRIIQQEIATNKQLLDNLLQRSKENDVVMAGNANNISVVDYAMAPGGPIGPDRSRTVMMAVFLSFALGVGLTLLLEYLDDTLHSSEEVERTLRLPALAIIPAIGGLTKRRLFGGSTALQRRNGNGHYNEHPELIIHDDGHSAHAEAYRHLRTSILLSTAGRAPRTLLVTSSLPSEGKTTTAVNTALALAQTGARVVVVDADMRRPRLRSIFNLSDRLGLSSILSNEVAESEMLEFVSFEENTGLYVLTSGPVPPNPAELLGSDQMRRLLITLQKEYTHVVVDSPPLASFTDGVLISTMVDGVVLVVHGGKCSKHIAKRTRQLLRDVGAKILGVVLNQVDVRSSDYYYYHKEYYAARNYKSDGEDEQPKKASAAAAGNSMLNL